MKDEQIAPQDRRTAGAVFVFQPQLTIGPRDFASLGVETRGAVRAEVTIQPAVFDHRAGRSKRVQRVNRVGVFFDHQFHIVQQLAGGAVDTHGPHAEPPGQIQRLIPRVCGEQFFLVLFRNRRFDRGGEPDLIPFNHRRRPPAPRQRSFPRDVLRFAPSHRQILRRGMTLAIRPAPLRPIGGDRDLRQTKHRRQNCNPRRTSHQNHRQAPLSSLGFRSRALGIGIPSYDTKRPSESRGRKNHRVTKAGRNIENRFS